MPQPDSNSMIALPRRTLLFVLTLVAGTITHTFCAIINRTNTASGNWSAAANWNPNQVPGNGDSAVITAAGNYTVTLDQTASVLGFTLGASSIGSTQTFAMNNNNLTVSNTGV